MKAKIKEGCGGSQGCDWFSVWGTLGRKRHAREKSDEKSEHEEGATEDIPNKMTRKRRTEDK